MKLLVSIVAVFLTISFAISASIPESPERRDNVIVLEPSKGSEGDRREGRTDDQEGEPFEIIVPVARNFSSLEELFQILREDDSKEPRGASAPTYVKGSEKNSSEYLIFFSDSAGKGKGSS